MVQSDKYYKSRAVGYVRSWSYNWLRSFSTDVLKKNDVFLYLRDTGSHVVRAIIQQKLSINANVKPPQFQGQTMQVSNHQNGKWLPATVITKYLESRSNIFVFSDRFSKRRNGDTETVTHKHVHLNHHVTSLLKKQNYPPWNLRGDLFQPTRRSYYYSKTKKNPREHQRSHY